MLRKVVWMVLENGCYAEKVFKSGRRQVRLPFSGSMEFVSSLLSPPSILEHDFLSWLIF